MRGADNNAGVQQKRRKGGEGERGEGRRNVSERKKTERGRETKSDNEREREREIWGGVVASVIALITSSCRNYFFFGAL